MAQSPTIAVQAVSPKSPRVEALTRVKVFSSPKFFSSGCPSIPPKRVILIRHGQAEHNVNASSHFKRDVQLTERGRMQAAAIRARVADLGADVVLTSPVLRTLQTTALLCPAVPVICVPDARECWVDQTMVCEAPAEPTAASSSGPFKGYDWSVALEQCAAAAAAAEAAGAAHASLSAWEAQLQTGDAKCSFLGDAKGLRARCKRLTEFIRSRPEETIALVSHAALLDFLTEDAVAGRMENCEVRTYELSTKGRWKRIQTLPSPTMAEMLDAPVTPSLSIAPPSPTLTITDGNVVSVCEAEGKMRGGSAPDAGRHGPDRVRRNSKERVGLSSPRTSKERMTLPPSPVVKPHQIADGFIRECSEAEGKMRGGAAPDAGRHGPDVRSRPSSRRASKDNLG